MANQDQPHKQPPKKRPAKHAKPIPSRVKRDPSGGWTLIPPHCVFELEPDLTDVEVLLKEGDADEARDAALYILEECQDMTAAHLLLARIAEKHSKDLIIAQGHYGYVFELTLKWLGDLCLSPMNPAQKINRISAECAEGLVRVLKARGMLQKSEQVERYLLAWRGKSITRKSVGADQDFSPEPESYPPAPKGRQNGPRPFFTPKKRRPAMNKPQRDLPAKKPASSPPQSTSTRIAEKPPGKPDIQPIDKPEKA